MKNQANKDYGWVVTGINRLSGRREPVSNPHTLSIGEGLLDRFKHINPRKRLFTYPMLERKEKYEVTQDNEGEQE